MTAIENTLFHFINTSCANRIFDILMPLVTAIGSAEGVFVIAVVLIVMKDKRMKRTAIFLFAGLAISYIAVHFLKDWIARPRPFMTLGDVRLPAGPRHGFAFPSGHAVSSFMAAAILSSFFKRCALFFTMATLVCTSRVYLGLHFVSDCVAGAALGLAIGYGLVYAAKAKDLF